MLQASFLQRWVRLWFIIPRVLVYTIDVASDVHIAQACLYSDMYLHQFVSLPAVGDHHHHRHQSCSPDDYNMGMTQVCFSKSSMVRLLRKAGIESHLRRKASICRSDRRTIRNRTNVIGVGQSRHEIFQVCHATFMQKPLNQITRDFIEWPAST